MTRPTASRAPVATPSLAPAPAIAKPRAAAAPLTQRERDRVLNLPLVREVMDVFDARLIDIRPETAASPTSPGPETQAEVDQES